MPANGSSDDMTNPFQNIIKPPPPPRADGLDHHVGRYVDALRGCQATVEDWVGADTVARRLGGTNPDRRQAAQVVGRELSRLAKTGVIERAWSRPDACWRYRP